MLKISSIYYDKHVFKKKSSNLPLFSPTQYFHPGVHLIANFGFKVYFSFNSNKSTVFVLCEIHFIFYYSAVSRNSRTLHSTC